MNDTLRDVLNRLKNVKRVGDDWSAKCPAHDDAHNSLTVAEGKDVKVLLHCHAGCSFDSILSVLEASGFSTNGNGNKASRKITAIYDYKDEEGKLVYQVVRFENKGFANRRPTGKEDWIWNLKDVRRLLYRLPELLQADKTTTVFIPEGEKDVDNLIHNGLVATCNTGGAGKWRDDYNEHLRGRHVVILPDNDAVGLDHAEKVAESLNSVAASIRIVRLPNLLEKGDVSDWLPANSINDLHSIVESVPLWKPLKAAKEKTKLRFTTLDDLLAEPEEEIAWVWDKTLPSGGFSICSAKPKVGKSTTARNLAVAVMRGDVFFGRPTTRGRVLYLCLEEKRSEVKRHFQRMGACGKDLLIHTGSAGENGLEELEEAVSFFQPLLVILDPLSRFARLTDFNDYAKVTRELEPIIDLARESGCHIMAVHHDGKGERDGGDSLLGSTALFGGVDTLLKMKRREFGRTLETIQRYGEDLPETICHLDTVTGIVSPQGDVKAHKLEERKKLVMESLAIGEELSESDLKDRIGGEQGLTSKAVRELFTEGKLERTGEGKRGKPYLYTKPKPDDANSANPENPENLENLENLETAQESAKVEKVSRFTDLDSRFDDQNPGITKSAKTLGKKSGFLGFPIYVNLENLENLESFPQVEKVEKTEEQAPLERGKREIGVID